ncbi:MAG: DUF4190 domain-containing protein [Bacilli bacterium]|nr:DUF4190 domain-containing protein [Bacilli bacterium]
MNQHCPACGTKIEGDSKFCTTCGYSLETKVNNQNSSQASNTNATNTNYDINNNFTTYEGVKQYTNGMAIAGLVISIVSLILCCGSISLIGLIFSIIGMNKAEQNNDIGKGIAIGGLVVNILGILLFLFWMLIWLIPFVGVMVSAM